MGQALLGLQTVRALASAPKRQSVFAGPRDVDVSEDRVEENRKRYHSCEAANDTRSDRPVASILRRERFKRPR